MFRQMKKMYSRFMAKCCAGFYGWLSEHMVNVNYKWAFKMMSRQQAEDLMYTYMLQWQYPSILHMKDNGQVLEACVSAFKQYLEREDKIRKEVDRISRRIEGMKKFGTPRGGGNLYIA